MELTASEGSSVKTGGDLAGENITKTITHNNDGGVTTSQLWTSLQLLGQKCDAVEKELRGTIEKNEEESEKQKIMLRGQMKDIQEQRIKDMRRIVAGCVGLLLLGVVALGYSLVTPENASAGVSGTYAFPEEVLNALEVLGNPSPPPNEYASTLIPTGSERHCIVQAVPIDSVSGMSEPECFDTIDEALLALARATGYDKQGLIVLMDNAKLFAGNDGVYKGMAQYSAVIGAWFSCPNYGCSSTVVYGGSNGCYDGSTWGVPIINQTVNSALKMGGCWTNTVHSSYYFGGAVQWCNCPTIALTVVSSAKYSP